MINKYDYIPAKQSRVFGFTQSLKPGPILLDQIVFISNQNNGARTDFLMSNISNLILIALVILVTATVSNLIILVTDLTNVTHLKTT